MALAGRTLACKERDTRAGVDSPGVGLVGKGQQGCPTLELVEAEAEHLRLGEAEGHVWAAGLGRCRALSAWEQVWRPVQRNEEPGQLPAISAPVPGASQSSPSAGEPVCACSDTRQ